MKIIYIMGAAHSGSTVLNAVLGSHPDAVAVSELKDVVDDTWLHPKRCSCGAKADACSYWTSIGEHLSVSEGNDWMHEYKNLQKKYESLRNIPRLLRNKNGNKSNAFLTYERQTKALFEAIAQVSGKKIIVDASKTPARALALSRFQGIDLVTIHLVRDGRAVAWSRMKKQSRRDGARAPSEQHAAGYTVLCKWIIVNMLCEWVTRRIGTRCIRLRYEDFVSSPAETLNSIGETANIDYQCVVDGISNHETIDFGHIVSGNRVRRHNGIVLKADTEWLGALPKQINRLFGLLAGPLKTRYRYF